MPPAVVTNTLSAEYGRAQKPVHYSYQGLGRIFDQRTTWSGPIPILMRERNTNYSANTMNFQRFPLYSDNKDEEPS
jgi:hypothetical protein